MIVGGYSMHLYCGNGQACKGRLETWHQPTFGDIYGTNERDCKQQARKGGWVFRDGDCYCPECKGIVNGTEGKDG